MRQLQITAEDAGQRLDKYLVKYLPGAPRSLIYKALRKKDIRLNGRRAEPSALLAAGDTLSIRFSEDRLAGMERSAAAARPEPESARIPSEKAFSILYEDHDLIVVNKAAGILSQKSRPEDISINELLLQYAKGRYDEKAAFVPSVCNRLDRNTSGILCFALNYRTARALSELLRDRRVEKYYLALVQGRVEEPGGGKAFLEKDRALNLSGVTAGGSPEASEIETYYEPVRVMEDRTLLRISLKTGRSHQIRAYMAYLGHPVLGDPKYGDAELNRRLRKEYGIRSQLLHSAELVFPETDGSLPAGLSGRRFQAPLPEAFKALI